MARKSALAPFGLRKLRPNNLLFQPRLPCNPRYTGAAPWRREPSAEHEDYILLEVRRGEFDIEDHPRAHNQAKR